MDKNDVLEGRQHRTLDMELFGPNSWQTGFHLAALKASAEMAEYFNGEYYHQLIGIKDKSILERFKKEDPNVLKTY